MLKHAYLGGRRLSLKRTFCDACREGEADTADVVAITE